MKGVLSRIAILSGTIAVLGAISVAPAFAIAVPGPNLVVANPASGDVLPRGRLYFTGQAWDPLAKTGSGISRISIYSAPGRDGGGVWLGTASKKYCVGFFDPSSSGCPLIEGRDQGAANFQGNAIDLSTPVNGWSIKSRITLTKHLAGTLYFYARSAITGAETVVTVDNVRIDPGRNVVNGKP